MNLASEVHASVVVPCAGTLTDLPELVDSVADQQTTFTWEVVFVDNGLDPVQRDVLEQQADRLERSRVVSETIRGIGPARNAGVRVSTGDVIVFVDADDVPAPGWLEALAGRARQGVLVGGHLDTSRLNPPWLAESRGRRSLDDPLPYLCEGVYPVAPGGNMALQRTDFDAIGGFVPDSRPLEDFDLSLRAWEAGLAVEHQPAAVLHYRLRHRPRDLYRQGLNYGKARARVYRELADRGLVRRWSIAGWKSWVLLAVTVPSGVLRRRRRASLAWIAGNRFGRLVGSAKYRVLYL